MALVEGLEEVAVVDDVAVGLVVAVEPVDSADGLEQAVVAHLLVDVEVGRARRVEAGQQLVDDDEQAHLAGLVDEAALDVLLELLDPQHRLVGRLVEVVRQHLPIDVVLPQLLVVALAGVLLGDRGGVRDVAGDDGDLALEAGLDEQLVELAGLVDAVADEHGVAATGDQARLPLEVHEDVLDDHLGARLGRDDLLHRAPLLLEAGLGEVGQSLGLEVEPLVDLLRSLELLVDVAGLVAQVQHDAVADGLVELVGVDERAERLDARHLVGLEQRRTGEADEHGIRQELLHGAVHLAALGAMCLVDEDEQIALGREVGRDRRAELLDEVVRVGVRDDSSSEPRNLCTSEHMSQGWLWLSSVIRSAPERERVIVSLTPPKTFSICSSSSVRSVMISTRASVWFSRIHLASQTMIRLLPEPWVCQMMPPSRECDALLSGLHAEELVVPGGLLDARVEDDEVVDELQEALLGAHLHQ